VGDILNEALSLIAKLAAIAFLATLVYTAYATFGGGLKSYPDYFTAALSNQLTHNAQVAQHVLIGSAVTFCVAVLTLWWGWEWAGPLFAAAGAIFYVGLPYFGVPHLSAPSMDLARQNHPGAEIIFAWRICGMAFFVEAGLFCLAWTWDLLQATLSAPRRAAGGLKVPFYSACWQTHHCKEEINKLCTPGKRGYHASCWRYKSGCYCDESIGDAMLASARHSMGDKAAMFLGTPSKAPAPTFADRFRSTHHRVAYQKIACADCPIYNYHELQKHRILAPIMTLGIPALMYYRAENLHSWYSSGLAAMDRFALHLAFDPNQTANLHNQIHIAFDVPLMEWMVYTVLAVVLITMAARLLEYWCFSAKL
jgi:hypothetical protein